MASNYPSDSKNASPINNPASPQNGQGSGPGGTIPEYPPYQAQAPASSTPGSSGPNLRLPAGTALSGGRYIIERSIASGGMGAVYRAQDTRLEGVCAVKEMLDNFQTEADRTQSVEWFRRESRLLLDLNHPCIPRVRDFFLEGGRHYLVMDFIEGRTLGEVLEKEGNLPGVNGARGVSEARARSWGMQVCNVLNYLHHRNSPIIFRDLKPPNIMVTDQDEIKLIDFGIARTFQSQKQATIIMTVGYAPPEQLLGSPEPRSDLYALGATLHRVLTHHDPSSNQPLYAFPMLRSLRPDITPAFEQVVIKALAPRVEQRWASAIEMERAILALPSIVGGAIARTVAGLPAAAPNPFPGPRTSMTGPAGVFINAAQGHLNTGQIEAAYAAVEQAHVREPNNAQVHKLFGQVFARRRPPSPDQAIQAYNRSLQLNSNDAETHKLVGDVSLFLRKQPAQAIVAYIESLRLNPNDSEAHQRLAECYEGTNQLAPALREYQEAVRLVPKNIVTQYALGRLAIRLNQFPVAERALVQVLTANAGDHQTRFLLAQVYENEGKLEDAWRECNFVLVPLGTNPAVVQMHQRLRARLGR